MSEPSLADVVHEAVRRAIDDEARKPVTLTEFLLARIAEDEAEINSLVVDYPETADDKRATLKARHPKALRDASVEQSVGRALAECEAKRRIVAELIRFNEVPALDDFDRGWQRALEIVAQHMTLPYAEHPDFDPAWRR